MSFLFSKNKKQLEAIFDWLSGVVNQDDLILLERGGKREGYYFEFPLKFGDKPRKIKTLDINDCTFLVRFSSGGAVPERNEWHLIFQSPELEIYESKKRFKDKEFKPLHWGLNDEEKKISLKIARKSLEIFLKEKKYPEIKDLKLGMSLPEIFNLKVDLDVAIWVDGVLRGSSVVEKRNLSWGIIEATLNAVCDYRFKPVATEEISQTKIEITLFSDLRIPLSREFIKKNEIIYNKGYLIERETKRGWFLPEVFNVARFKDLHGFLSRLGIEKASLDPKEIFDRETVIYIFEIQDFIEGITNEDWLDLDGPLVKIKRVLGIEESAFSAADWLVNIQESDGNFPPIINPINVSATSQIDWLRTVFSGWSLIEFGKATNNSIYIKAGKKSFFYVKQYFLEKQILNDSYKLPLVLAYFGQAALSLGRWQEAHRGALKILEKENSLQFEPILFSQLGSFFAELSKVDRNFWETSLRFTAQTERVLEMNLQRNQEMHLAAWAELANLYIKIFEISANDNYFKKSCQILDWLLRYQFKSGAFASGTKSDFVYTRGTGKIAEVLASFISLKQIDSSSGINYYRECLEKTFAWLATMQYLPENSYFVPGKDLKNIIGGFRHDHFNNELWIDSAAHYILAASRYLKS